MKILVLFICGVAICAVFFFYGEWIRRVVLSGVLILQARPYERNVPNAPTIMVVGDSTAYGTGSSDPKLSVAGRIAGDFPEYSIINKGKNGQTVKELLRSFSETTIPADTAVLLIQIGGNDILQFTNPDSLRTDIRKLLIEATARSPQTILMTSGNVGGAEAFAPYGSKRSQALEERTLLVREIFMEESLQQGVAYVDLYRAPSEDVFIQEPERYMAQDGLHPNGEGYGVWYASLLPVLQSHLRR